MHYSFNVVSMKKKFSLERKEDVVSLVCVVKQIFRHN